MIPAAFIQDLLTRTDIVEVVGRNVELRRSGANFAGLCPFHTEKSPSFTVSPSKQFYHCFGCGAHGDAIRFLVEHAGVSFLDAVNDLAQRAGMSVPQEQSSVEERERVAALKKQQATLTEVLAKAAEHYGRQLKSSAVAVAYLKRRGLSGEIATKFSLGYAPPGWRGLAGVFASYDDPLLEESGLVIAQEPEAEGGDSKRYDRFRDRIMFPIRSVQGEVIGLGGRVLDQGEPKYLNSPETPVFVKGRELYGLFEARAALRQKGYVLVVEGYMDVVALAQLGFPNAVATLGTACTAEHVQKLFRFTDSVIFSFDGDAAGRRAARRALEAALPYASDVRSIRFLFLPAEHDPDSFVRANGPQAFERCITEAVPLSRHLLDATAEGCNLDTAEGRARMLACARPMWTAIPDGALKRQVLADLAAHGRLDLNELSGLWGLASPRSQRQPTAQRAARPAQRLSRTAATLLDRALWLLVQRSDLWLTLDANAHELLALQAAPYDALFGCLERSVHEDGPLGSNALLEKLRVQAQSVSEAAVVERIAAFHDPDCEYDRAQEIAIVFDRLRLHAVEEELKLLFESGVLSVQAQQRGRELIGAQAHLKAVVARASTDRQSLSK